MEFWLWILIGILIIIILILTFKIILIKKSAQEISEAFRTGLQKTLIR